MSDLRRRFTKLPETPDADSAFRDPHREPYDPIRTPLMLPLANFAADLLSGQK